MECQDVKALLAFVNRPSEELDAEERSAVQQHLEKCPDCAEMVQTERTFDEAVGAVLREVPIPAGLKEKILGKLAPDPAPQAAGWASRLPWKSLAIAAALLIALGGGAYWYTRPLPEVTSTDVEMMLVGADNIVNNVELPLNDAKAFLENRGLPPILPAQLNGEYLRSIEVIHLKGRAVGKATYVKGTECTAQVLILRRNQWKQVPQEDPTAIKILEDMEHQVTYLILFRGTLKALHHQAH